MQQKIALSLFLLSFLGNQKMAYGGSEDQPRMRPAFGGMYAPAPVDPLEEKRKAIRSYLARFNQLYDGNQYPVHTAEWWKEVNGIHIAVWNQDWSQVNVAEVYAEFARANPRANFLDPDDFRVPKQWVPYILKNFPGKVDGLYPMITLFVNSQRQLNQLPDKDKLIAALIDGYQKGMDDTFLLYVAFASDNRALDIIHNIVGCVVNRCPTYTVPGYPNSLNYEADMRLTTAFLALKGFTVTDPSQQTRIDAEMTTLKTNLMKMNVFVTKSLNGEFEKRALAEARRGR